jgi:hypothetical protein
MRPSFLKRFLDHVSHVVEAVPKVWKLRSADSPHTKRPGRLPLLFSICAAGERRALGRYNQGRGNEQLRPAAASARSAEAFPGCGLWNTLVRIPPQHLNNWLRGGGCQTNIMSIAFPRSFQRLNLTRWPSAGFL